MCSHAEECYFPGASTGESDRNPLFTRRKSMSDGTSSVGLFGKPVSSGRDQTTGKV